MQTAQIHVVIHPAIVVTVTKQAIRVRWKTSTLKIYSAKRMGEQQTDAAWAKRTELNWKLMQVTAVMDLLWIFIGPLFTLCMQTAAAVTSFNLLRFYSAQMKKTRLLCTIDYGLATHWLHRLSSSILAHSANKSLHTYDDEAEHFRLCCCSGKCGLYLNNLYLGISSHCFQS